MDICIGAQLSYNIDDQQLIHHILDSLIHSQILGDLRKKYSGTFGTNGFYLPMDGNSPIGVDKSRYNNQ